MRPVCTTLQAVRQKAVHGYISMLLKAMVSSKRGGGAISAEWGPGEDEKDNEACEGQMGSIGERLKGHRNTALTVVRVGS
jgi:hypothetical protein